MCQNGAGHFTRAVFSSKGSPGDCYCSYHCQCDLVFPALPVQPEEVTCHVAGGRTEVSTPGVVSFSFSVKVVHTY